MSVRDDITYKWTRDNATISVTRTITGDSGSVLDLAVPNGSTRLPAAFAFTLAQLKSFLLTSDQAVTLDAGGTDAVQTIAMAGPPTAGTFPLTKGADTTPGLAYNATAATVQAALRLLASVGTAGVNCTGGPLPGTPVVCTFVGVNAAQPVATMTTSSASLTGGTVAVTSTTTGVAPHTTRAIAANLPFVWDSQGYYAQPFAADVARLLVTNASGVDAAVKVRTLSSAS
jgi:hypothetical protein